MIPSHTETANWSDAEYFAFPAMNATALKQLSKSPQLYQHHLKNPKPKTSSMVLGSATHCLTFEPYAWAERYAVWDGGSRRTKAYREWAEAHEAEGLEVITAEEHARALETAEAASKHPLLSELLIAKGTQVERAIVWQGLFGPCKAKIDLLHYSDKHGLVIVDLKTTSSDLDEHTLTHTIGRYLVHLQLWHYLHAACMLLDVDLGNVDRLRLVAVYAQTSAPHDVVACELGPETMMQTADLYRELAALYEGCNTMGYWPGYSPQRTVEVPHYYTTIKK
jgi:hypothetical protein